MIAAGVMKVGDLVAFKSRPLHPDICECKCCLRERGIILRVDDSHRQTSLTILSKKGEIIKKVWVNHVKVIK